MNDILTAYVAGAGSLLAITVSVLSYINQLRAREAEDKLGEKRHDAELKRLQTEISNKVWLMAQEQLDECSKRMDQFDKELAAERSRRRKVEVGLRRTIGMVSKLLAQIKALNAVPDLSPEDQKWLEDPFDDI